MFIDFPIDTTL